jgi:ABC-type multidrug transport system ATPase subunit
MFAIEFQGVNKMLGRKQVLKDLSFTVPEGQVTALLGPNGAGKTTSIRLLLGILRPDQGEIRLFGEHVSASIVRRRIALLSQENSGYKTLSAKENLQFFLELQGVDFRDAQGEITLLLNTLHLAQSYHKRWGVLSVGEKKSFGLIRTVLSPARILVLDEPTAGLDLERASGIRNLIQQQIELGKTVLMSSHIMTDIEELAQNLVVIKDGQILGRGSTNQIIDSFAPSSTIEQALLVAFKQEIN